MLELIFNGESVLSLDCLNVTTIRESPIDPELNNEAVTDEAADGMVRITWRLLSCVQAWPHNTLNKKLQVNYGYDDGNFLRPAVDFINEHHPEVLWSHFEDATQIVGRLYNARWEDSTDIPPGINADLVIDPEFDPKAARGLKNGIITAGSIGIDMDLVPSHPKMSVTEFLSKQGKQVNGKVVECIPSAFRGIRHMALVVKGTGADPNAGLRMANMTIDMKQGERMSEDMKIDEMAVEEFACLKSISNKLGVIVEIENDEIPVGLANKLDEKVDALLLKAESVEKIEAKLTSLSNTIQGFESYVALENEALTAQQILERLPKRLEFAEAGEKLLNLRQKEALKWFDAAKFDNNKTLEPHEERLRARIEVSTDLEYLADIIEEYRLIADNRMGTRRVSEQFEAPTNNTEISTVEKLRDMARAGVVSRLHKKK